MKIKVLEYRDPVELFDDWGYCKICNFRIEKPCKERSWFPGQFEHEEMKYRHAIDYHFEHHLKRGEIIEIKIEVDE